MSIPMRPPTITSNDTRAGVVIGTAAYMSPEQARGLTVDKRTDIWAFGCVLFEMLTGQSPFAGPTASDTIAATLEREPPWSLLPPALPARIRELLQRCLEKDPRQRLRDIGDAAVELGDRHAVEGGASRSARLSHCRRDCGGGRRRDRRRRCGSCRSNQWQRRPMQPESRLVIDNIAAGIAARRLLTGRRLTRHRAAIRSTGAIDSAQAELDRSTRHCPAPKAAIFPFWSPDGRSIAFFAERKLKRIDLVGETVQEIADAPIGRGGAWTADGSILFAPSATGALSRVPASGGQAVAFTTLATRSERSSRSGDSPGWASLHFLRARIGHASAACMSPTSMAPSRAGCSMPPQPPSTRRPATCCSRARISCWRSVSIRSTLTLERRAIQDCRQRRRQSRRQPRNAGRFVGRRHRLCHGRHHAAPVCVVRSIGRGGRPGRNTGYEPGHEPRAVAGRAHARIRAIDGRQLGHLADGDGAWCDERD